MEKRFVVMNIKKDGDSFETVLKAGATREEAEAVAADVWGCMCAQDQRKSRVELAELAWDPEEGLVIETADAEGMDCLSAYTPIVAYDCEEA